MYGHRLFPDVIARMRRQVDGSLSQGLNRKADENDSVSVVSEAQMTGATKFSGSYFLTR